MAEQLYFVTASIYEEPTYGVCQSGGQVWGDSYVCRGLAGVNERLAWVLRDHGPRVRFVVRPLGEPIKLYEHEGEVPQPPKPVRIVSVDPVDFGKRVAALSPSSK